MANLKGKVLYSNDGHHHHDHDAGPHRPGDTVTGVRVTAHGASHGNTECGYIMMTFCQCKVSCDNFKSRSLRLNDSE